MTQPNGLKIDVYPKGIRNKVDPMEVGFAGLLQAINVNLSAKGKPSRRDGFTELLAIGGHSGWANQRHCLFVRNDGWLCSLGADLATVSEVRDVGSADMVYADIMGDAYYSNGKVIGYLDRDGHHELSGFGTYDFSPTDLSPTKDREAYSPMPPGTVLEYHSGVLYAYSEEDEVIYFSRRNDPRKCNMDDDIIRFSGVTMIAGVNDGVYFGGDFGVYFMLGNNPAVDVRVSKVDEAAPIKGTMLKADGGEFGSRGWPGQIAVWESTSGKVLGPAGGNVYRMTDREAGYPVGEKGTSLILQDRGQKYLASITRNPSGDNQHFQATDYASAEIRRNGITI